MYVSDIMLVILTINTDIDGASFGTTFPHLFLMTYPYFQAFEADAELHVAENIRFQTSYECKVGNIWPSGLVAFAVKDLPVNCFVCDF